MWWDQPLLQGFSAGSPPNLLEVVARAFAVVQVGGLQGTGPERGRNFERLFYSLCEHRGLLLTETAGSRSVGAQRANSGFRHEVDAASRGPTLATHWELKHLSVAPSKNDFLIFNGKSLDFLLGHESAAVKTPLFRFFLTATNVSDESRRYSAFWGISIIEPDRLPLILLYEAVSRGGASHLSTADCKAVKKLIPRAFCSVQQSILDLATQVSTADNADLGMHWINEVSDLQEQIGREMFDHLDESEPDWLDRLAENTWFEVGGW